MLELAGVRLEIIGLNQFTSGMASAQRSVDSFANSGTSINRSLGPLNTSLNNVGRSAVNFGTGIASQATVAQRGFGGLVTSVTRGAGLITTALLPLAGGLALGGLASSAVGVRVEFERSLANVGAVSRATAGDLDRLREVAEELGRTTSFSAVETLGAAQFTSLAGLSIDETIQVLPGLLNTAAAAQTDLAETSDIVTNALTGFQLGVAETARVSDVLIATTTSSNTGLTDLSQALSFVAPEAARVGESVEDASAALGLLADSGLRATRGGTGLRRIYSNLITPVGEAGEALRDLGITTFDQEGNFVGLANVLGQFEGALEGVSQQGREDVLSQIFDTNSLTAFSVLLSAGSDELRNFTTELENSGGVAEQVAGRQLDNLAGDITRAQSAYEGLQLAVTRRATPALRGFFNQALIPGITATTNFVEALNDGQSTLRAFSIGFSAVAPNASEFVGNLLDISDAAFGLQNLNLNLDGLLGLDTVRVFRLDDLLTFEVGNFSGLIRGAFEEVQLNLGDFITFDFDAAAGFTQLQIGDFFAFTSEDVSSVFSDATANITKLTIGDFIDFTATSGPAGTTVNINDVIIGTYDLANNITTLSISDLITGTLDLTTGQGSVTLGEDLTFEFDLGALQSQIQGQLSSLQDFVLGAAGGFEAALTGDFTFELPDIGAGLQAAIDTALGGIALTFAVPALAAANAFEIEIPAPLLDFVVPDIAGQEFQIAIPAPLLDFEVPDIAGQTFEIAIPAPLLDFAVPIIGSESLTVTIPDPDVSYLIPVIETEIVSVQIPEPVLDFLAPVLGDTTTLDIPVPTALTEFDFAGLSGGLDAIGGALSRLDEGIAGATGADSTLAGFVTVLNEQIGGLATTLDSVDSTSIGESITGVITSLTSIFTQLNTIDDLALGGIAGSLSSLTESILGFATGLTAGLDGDAIGEAAATSAATFISSFQAVFSEPDLPAIAGAAAGLVAGIGEQLRAAFEPGNFTVVGASLGQLTSTIIEQLSNTFSDPQFAADIGQGLADVLVGITQGLADVLSGFNTEIEGADSELGSATSGFVANLISALASGLAEADYGQVVAALVTGIGNSLSLGFGGLQDFAGGSAGESVGRGIRSFFTGTDQTERPELFTPSVVGTLVDPGAQGDAIRQYNADIADFNDSIAQAAADDTVTRATQAISDLGEGLQVIGLPALVGELSNLGETGLAEELIAASRAQADLATATNSATQAVQAQTAAQTATAGGELSEFVAAPEVDNLSAATGDLATTSQQATGFIGSLTSAVSGFFGFGADTPAPEARRTGLGEGIAFDETDIAGSVQDQILTQLNFGDLPQTVSDAATEAIATAIPAEALIDSELITSTLSEAVTAAIPAEPVIDAESVNETLLLAAQEAIPASEIEAFPGWMNVLDIDVPAIPRFPGWKAVADFKVPRIPRFPGWSSFINFDIPSIPSFPGWSALTGSVDLGAIIPPFPGWASLIAVDVRVPNVSCELSCGGGSSNSGGGSGGAEFTPLFTGTTFFRGGLALVSERGNEAVILPNGETFIAQGEQLINLPAGTQVIDAPQTSRLLNGDTAPLGNQISGGGAVGVTSTSAVSNVGISGRAAAGVATTSIGGDQFNEEALATGIIEAFRDTFNLPGFPGWRATLGAPDIVLPPFPGWSSITGLEDISVSIFRTENIIEDNSGGGGRDISIGPITPIAIPFAAGIAEAAAIDDTVTASGIPVATTAAGQIVQSPPNVTNNVTNNVTRNFNLTTESLRSTEQVNGDFARMEQLASISGVI